MTGAATEASWCGLPALEAAARRCSRGKRASVQAIGFRMREGEELLALADRLADGRYGPEPGRVFVTERPKYREVHAAAYRDRVVHHLLHALLEPAFEPRFSPASFACRRGKGTHAAVFALQRAMWNLSRHGGVRVVALQMDVVNFFMSLHRPTLLALLEPVVGEVEAALGPQPGITPWELCQRIVLHDPTRGGRRTGDRRLFARVPPQKRFGALGPDCGLPIGNLTSQFFANVYLTPLDHFVQRRLGFRGYVRYVDDFVLLHTDTAWLESARERIVQFLRERLRLEVKARPVLPVSRGVDFLGYVVRPRYLLPRRRVVDALRGKLAALETDLAPLEVGPGACVSVPGLRAVRGPVRVSLLDEATNERLRAVWSSYEGHLGHAAAWKLRQRLWREQPACARRLGLRAGKTTRRFALGRPSPSLRAQVARLERGITPEGAAARAVLVVQVGCFAEVPRGGARFGLRRSRGRRHVYGMPWRFAHRVIERILRAGHPVAVALERDELSGSVKRRELAYLFEPLGGSDLEES